MDSQGRASKGGQGASSHNNKSVQISMPCVMKLLAPEILAAAVIGKGGAAIAEMRQKARAKIALTESGQYYPHTDCRVVTVQADTEEALVEVGRGVIAKIAHCSENTGLESLGQAGALRLKTPVPRVAVGGIIGKGGAAIKHLREVSGAKIFISEATGSGQSAEQVVSIEGTAEALETVLAEVVRQTQSLNQEPWFSTWASASSISSGYSGGNGAANSSSWSDWGKDSHYGGRNNSEGHLPPGMDLLMQVAQDLPPYVLDDSRGFALSFLVPSSLVGGVTGRGGAGTKEVQNLTGTKIGIREIPGDEDNQSMNIAGPLGNTCAAYMMMMQRYLDAEESANSAASGSKGSGDGHW